jgi:putative hydrolase of the HAD superfamily
VGALKALVFDLDDTLFPEVSYIKSGFHAVADWLDQAGVLPAQQAFEALWSAHAGGERGRLFDHLLAACPGASEPPSVADLVRVYRSHAPGIAFYPGMAALLDEAKARSLPIAVISDGFLEAQQQKAKALGLAQWANPILFTDTWGRAFWKPHTWAFAQVQETFQVEPDEIIYIGDNPSKDFQAPHALGWHSLQLVMPDQVHAERPGAAARTRIHGIQALRAHLFAPVP